MRTWVKFCGCTTPEDAALAADAGADAFGMIFAPSPRRIAWEAAAAIARTIADLRPEPVAVVVDPTPEELAAVESLFPNAWVQFSGTEPAELVAAYGSRGIKAIHVGAGDEPAGILDACRRYPRARILFDTKSDARAGGSGARFPWVRVAAAAVGREVVVAGGLTPNNVGDCLVALRPYGVDVRSGVESDGRKDPAKMRAFVRAVRETSLDDDS